MWFEKLKEVLKDNAEALQLLETAKTNFETLKANLDAANAKFEEAKTTRDKVKEQLRKVKSLFNVDSIDEINEDFLKSLKGDKADSELQKEVEALKAQLQDNLSKIKEKDKLLEETKSTYEQKLQNLMLDSEASKVLATVKLKDNPYVVETFKNALLEGVKEVDGVLVPHKEVNGQLIPMTKDDGTFMTLQDKKEQMLKDKAWQDFIITDQKAGQQYQQNGNSINKSIDKMSYEEKYQYYKSKAQNGG
jgi:hypothetical protein